MTTVADILDAVEQLAPPRFAFSFDKVGLQVGDANSEASALLVTLDLCPDSLDAAIRLGANVVVAHHPLIFTPISSLTGQDRTERLVQALIQRDCSFIAAHTNWDCAEGGINDVLAQKLGLNRIEEFGSTSKAGQLKLVTFVPIEATERVIGALARAGAGKIGHYDNCAFVTEGQGRFRGNEASNPAIGKPGVLETVRENRVEVVLPESLTSLCISALRGSHPYEEPAYDLYRVEGFSGHPIGRIGSLPNPLNASSFMDLISDKLNTVCRAWHPQRSKPLTKVAVVGGAGSDEWRNALKAGADTLVTGEVRHHHGIEASEEGLLVIEAGHYATEQPGVRALGESLQSNLSLPVHVYER